MCADLIFRTILDLCWHFRNSTQADKLKTKKNFVRREKAREVNYIEGREDREVAITTGEDYETHEQLQEGDDTKKGHEEHGVEHKGEPEEEVLTNEQHGLSPASSFAMACKVCGRNKEKNLDFLTTLITIKVELFKFIDLSSE